MIGNTAPYRSGNKLSYEELRDDHSNRRRRCVQFQSVERNERKNHCPADHIDGRNSDQHQQTTELIFGSVQLSRHKTQNYTVAAVREASSAKRLWIRKRSGKPSNIFAARTPSCATSFVEPAHFDSSCGGTAFMLWCHQFCLNKYRERLQHRFERGSKNMLRPNGFPLKVWAD